MPDPKIPEAMTAAQAAKLVVRLQPELGKDGKPTGKHKEIPVREDEVLSFHDYGHQVVVVTRDGQKLAGKQ